MKFITCIWTATILRNQIEQCFKSAYLIQELRLIGKISRGRELLSQLIIFTQLAVLKGGVLGLSLAQAALSRLPDKISKANSN